MRLFTILPVSAGMILLGSMPAAAVAGTMLVATSERADCEFAASTGDNWMSHSTGGSLAGGLGAGGAAVGREPAGGSGCRTADRRAVVDAAPRPSVAVDPETTTWLLIIGGFGLISLGMRARTNTVAS